MALYFLHLRDGIKELLDTEGREFASLAALRDAVLFAARDVLMADVGDGLLDLRLRIDARTKAGRLSNTLAFKQAVNIIPEGSTPAATSRAS